MRKLLLILCAALALACSAVAGCSMSGGGSSTRNSPSALTKTGTSTENEDNGGDTQNDENEEDGENIPPECPDCPERPPHKRPEPRPFKGRDTRSETGDGFEERFFLEIDGNVPMNFHRFIEDSITEEGDIFAKDVNYKAARRKKHPDVGFGREMPAPRGEFDPTDESGD